MSFYISTLNVFHSSLVFFCRHLILEDIHSKTFWKSLSETFKKLLNCQLITWQNSTIIIATRVFLSYRFVKWSVQKCFLLAFGKARIGDPGYCVDRVFHEAFMRHSLWKKNLYIFNILLWTQDPKWSIILTVFLLK